MTKKKRQKERALEVVWKELFESWHGLTNESKARLFAEALEAAQTFIELRTVYEATVGVGTPGGKLPLSLFNDLKELRKKSLREIIDIAKNPEEAKIALELASRKMKDGRLWKLRFPALRESAVKRARDFALPT